MSRRTAVKLFGIGYASGKFAQYAEVPFDGLTNGVVGGGFRASSRVTVVNSKGASVFGFSWENFTSPQEAYVGALRKDGTASAAAVSNVNAAAAKHVFPTYEVVKWTSDDGTDVEGILAQPPATARKSAGVLPPLLVFTHCGPAMYVSSCQQRVRRRMRGAPTAVALTLRLAGEPNRPPPAFPPGPSCRHL